MSRTYVQDPISVSYFILPTRHGDVRVLLFGEWHQRKTKCYVTDPRNDRIMSFPIFLRLYQSMFATTTLDLFTESTLPIPSKLPAVSKKQQSNTHWDYGLGFLRKYLDRCAPKFVTENMSRTYDCPENLRVHLCDIRQISVYPYRGYSKKPRDERPFKILGKYFDHSHMKSGDIRDFPSFIDYWDTTLNDRTSVHYIDTIFQMSMDNLKITKQIDHIRSKRMRAILMDWGIKEWIHLLAVVRERWKVMKTRYDSRTFLSRLRQRVFFGKSNTFVTATVTPFLNATIDLNTILMDMYLMGRLLRTFSDGTSVHHAIIYTGEFHSYHYRTIMRLLGATELFTSVPPNVNYDTELLKSLPSCVDITPLFSLGLV